MSFMNEAFLPMSRWRSVARLSRCYAPDLRILIMSATLDMPQLSEILKAPIVESQGKQYPVEIIYAGGLRFDDVARSYGSYRGKSS